MFGPVQSQLYFSTTVLGCHSTAVSSAPKASWVVVMYAMNNHTYNAMQVCYNRTYKALYLSSLGAKDTTQSLWETLVSLLKKCCCHKKCRGRVLCAAV